jgi:tRNA A58 N-methylase Trm61
MADSASAYRKALRRIAKGEPGPVAIAQRALENEKKEKATEEEKVQKFSGPVPSETESTRDTLKERLHEVEGQVDLLILDLRRSDEQVEEVKQLLREATRKMGDARRILKEG